MTRDDHKNIVNQLLAMATPENQASASDLLTQLTDDYEKTLTDFENATANVTQLTQNNETLRQVNAKLFLKVGETDKGNDPGKGNDNGGDDMPQINFEDLFNEKGELK